MRLALYSLLLVLALAHAAAGAQEPPRTLFVYGDSLAMFAKPFMPAALPGWRVEQEVAANRGAARAERALRSSRRARRAGVIHVSLGTIDDPSRPDRFRLSVRRAMRAAGDRCVVWANVWRPSPRLGAPQWTALNEVLDSEARRRTNLVVVDWWTLVSKNRRWLDPIDNTHVDDEGSRARAQAVAAAVEECHRRLALRRPV